MWTAAHVGTEGNEKADQLAKAGALKPDMQQINVPNSQLKAEIDRCFRERWAHEWEKYKGARQTKFFYPGPDKKKAKEVMSFDRRQLGRYVRVVTGHNNLLYHRNNVDPVHNDSMCRFCGEDVETFIHFATDCPARWRERRDMLLVYIGDSLMDWAPNQLLRLAYTPEINRLLEMRYDSDGNMEVDSDEEEEHDGMEQEGSDPTLSEMSEEESEAEDMDTSG